MNNNKKNQALEITKKIIHVAGKIINVFLLVILSVFLIYNIYSLYASKSKKIAFPMLMGFGSAVVTSGSMEPTINIDDLIIVMKKKEYNVGDIVTFADEYGTSITHRIIGVRSDGSFRTKGDYQGNSEDSYRLYNDSIYGKVILTVPKFAKVKKFFGKTEGVLVLIVLVLLVVFAPNIANKIKKLVKKPDDATNTPSKDGKALEAPSEQAQPQNSQALLEVSPYTDGIEASAEQAKEEVTPVEKTEGNTESCGQPEDITAELPESESIKEEQLPTLE